MGEARTGTKKEKRQENGTPFMHSYRTHTCGELRIGDEGQPARLSGWIHRKRDHGNLLFVDLRDHFGVTQCVIDVSSDLFSVAEAARPESVLTVTGCVVKRTDDTINPALPTGEVKHFPTNTSDALTSGGTFAIAGAIERMVENVLDHCGQMPTCIMTGGAGWKMAPTMKLPFELVDNLIFDGLLEIASRRFGH